MTARFDRRVTCPFCGVRIALADCPIVATNALATDDLRRRFHRDGPVLTTHQSVDASGDFDAGAIGSAIDDEDEMPGTSNSPPPAPGPIRRGTSGRGFEPGSELESQIDRELRIIVSAPPVEPPALPGRRLMRSKPIHPLPSPVDLAEELGGSRLRPARACPRPSCHHPLPIEIDDRDPFVVALVGNTGASKTTLLAALVDLAEKSEGREALQLDEFSCTQRTSKTLRPVLHRYRRGEAAKSTEGDAIARPLEFALTLSRFPNQPIVLLLHDVPGEVYMDEDYRAIAAAHIMWSDTVIFLANPEEAPGIELLESDADQATVLNGIHEDITSRGSSGVLGQHRPYPPLVMAVSKADVLRDEGVLNLDDLTPESIRKALQAVGADDVLAAADRWPSVQWLAVAPMPVDGQPLGVAELFRVVLAAMTDSPR